MWIPTLLNGMNTHYCRPAKFFEIKLSSGPNEKNDVLPDEPLIAQQTCDWVGKRSAGMTSDLDQTLR